MASPNDLCFEFPYRWPQVAAASGLDMDQHAVELLEERDRALEDAITCGGTSSLRWFITYTSAICC